MTKALCSDDLVDKITEGVVSRAEASDLLPFEKNNSTAEGPTAAADVHSHPSVRHVIEKFWAATTTGDENVVDQARYVYLHIRIQKAMLPDFVKSDAIAFATEEFNEELDKKRLSGSRPTSLDKSAFFNSIFEVAESWSEIAEAAAYTHFLSLLLARIVCPATGALYKSLDDVHYCAELSEPAKPQAFWSGGWDIGYRGGVGAGTKKGTYHIVYTVRM